jgi:hypothetical protein
MYIIRIYPDEHKVPGTDRIAMVWDKVLSNGNYDYKDMIEVLQNHRDELGITVSNIDIAEIVNVEGIAAINYYMTTGSVEEYWKNQWEEA